MRGVDLGTMRRAPVGSGRACWAEHLDGDRELALLTGWDSSDAHDLARHLDAAVVRDRYHDRILPRFAAIRMANRSFHAKRGEGGDNGVPTWP
jgi:hypothetical protein